MRERVDGQDPGLARRAPYRRVGHKIILDAADIAAFMERGKKRNGL